MSLFPKVQSPCPYKGKFADIMQGNQCRLCKREVIDLTEMAEAERKQFLAACEGEVCISYRVGAKSALAAMAMSTVAIPTAAAAQDTAQPQADAPAEEDSELYYIIVGGMKKPHDAKWVKDEQSSEAPALPVEYDDTPAMPAKKGAKPATKA